MLHDREGVSVFGFGWMELVVVLAIVLVLFGAGKLPQLGEGLGKAIKNFKESVTGKDAIDVTPKKGPDDQEKS
jgi:sec-independent protein translocase protein TatA